MQPKNQQTAKTAEWHERGFPPMPAVGLRRCFGPVQTALAAWNHLHLSRPIWCETEWFLFSTPMTRTWQQRRVMWKCVAGGRKKDPAASSRKAGCQAKVNVKRNRRLITKARVKKPEESNQSLKYAAAKLITSGFVQVDENLESPEINHVGANILKHTRKIKNHVKQCSHSHLQTHSGVTVTMAMSLYTVEC